MKNINFDNADLYLRTLGISDTYSKTKVVHFVVNTNTENIEFYRNGLYFCSVDEFDNDTFEVFELHHGAEISVDGKEWLTDGELWQYRTYKSLKCAIDFTVKCAQTCKLPNKALKIW